MFLSPEMNRLGVGAVLLLGLAVGDRPLVAQEKARARAPGAPLPVRFTPTRSSHATRRPVSSVSRCSRTGSRSARLFPGRKPALAPWRRSRLSIPLMANSVSI